MLPISAGKIRAERVADLLERQFPLIKSYVNQDILTKGGTLLLGGQAKVGKSFTMMEFMRSLSTGKPLFDNPDFSIPEPVRVLYVDMEVGGRTNKERLAHLLANEDKRIWGDRLYIVSKEEALDFQLDNTQGLLKAADLIKDVKPNVLVLDPISFMYHGDENKPTDVGMLFYNLAKLKEKGHAEELSIIFSHHFGKPPRGPFAKDWDPLDDYNFRGASKWKDGGDTLITMKRGAKLRETPEAWALKMRFTTRHGSSYPEGWAEFNWDGDLRIKWRKEGPRKGIPKGELPPLRIEHPSPIIDFSRMIKEKPKSEQLMFGN